MMNYKETLFFVAKCLTISHEKKNLEIVKKLIITNQVDWDSVVKISTAHYVFPALYCNLKRADLLKFLHNDLVSYMKHITDLNRERNLEIIEQAKEINQLLKSNGITPIFLKGTGFLLQTMYNDVAERMVGDIDFLVSYKDYQKTITILKDAYYSAVYKIDYHFPQFKHYQRIQKAGKIAAVEIHKEMLLEKYSNEFNYKAIEKNFISKNNISFLGLADQLALTIIAYQINDSGQYLNTISLRNAYDTFLLSKKVNTLKSIEKFHKLYHPLNNYLSVCESIFDADIFYKKTEESKKYLSIFYKIINSDSFRKNYLKTVKRKLFINKRIRFVMKSFVNKDYRYWLFRRLTDKNWYKEKMIQLGIKSNP